MFDLGSGLYRVLTDASPLIHEAVVKANPVDYDGTPTRVFGAEYLCAIALQTGRTKDHLRVRMFLEQAAVERNQLSELLERFGLMEKFEQFGGL